MGPLHFEPTEQVLSMPPGPGPVVVVAPSTATTGTTGLAETAVDMPGPRGEALPAGARVVVSRLGGPDLTLPPWAVAGLGRQDDLLSQADVVICGGGHGMVAKTLLAGRAAGGGARRRRPVGDRQSGGAPRQWRGWCGR